MGDRWKFLTVLMGFIFGTGIVAILSSEAPILLLGLIMGGALVGTTAFIFRSPIGEAIAARIRKGLPAMDSIHMQDMIRQEIEAERLRRFSSEAQQKLQAEFPEGLVAIMFTDMEGFTQYVERGDEAAYRVLQRHNRVIREVVEREGGRIVKSYGDGFMVAFSSARRALLAAVAIQARFQSYNGAVDDEEQIRVRIGLDAGEPLKQGDDYIGRAVNLAARIAGAAQGGQIFISEMVKQLVGPISGLQYLDREAQHLKGFTEKQHLYEVARIEALAYPLDSEVEQGLADLEKQVKEEG